MILCQNYEIIVSLYIYLIVQIICKIVNEHRSSMYNKQPTLTSIPELIEKDEEIIKWVPKKKHEVLKAKYKCLKKLFQIYDASVIGILPQNNTQQFEDERAHRRKRSRRTKTDACAGTTDSSGDVSETDAATVINELKLKLHSSSQVNNDSNTSLSNSKDDKSTQDSKDASIGDCSERLERKKPTRFQIFLQRILGIRCEKSQCYGGSENNINRCERRRRSGLQFRRFGRARRTKSDIALKGAKEPIILSYVQSIQRSYLTDTTPRHCPIVGCDMISYGIINYNDHLNLSHFPERKYICHYCHEGFMREYEKVVHENEHIGISKINNPVASAPSTTRYTTKIASNTQTEPETHKIDVPEEKLKKIVSFFDKISNPEKVVAEIKNRSSDTNLHTFRSQKTETQSVTTKSDDSSSQRMEKRGFSCGHFHTSKTSLDSNLTPKYLPVRCQLCGECFENRRQLSLHIDIEHRVNHKFSKFHSCAGILNHGKVDKRLHSSQTLATSADTDKSTDALSCDPSTNIVYYTSTESVRPCKDVVRSVKSGFCYKWEPCTSVVRI